MGQIGYAIQGHLDDMERLAEGILEHATQVRALQATCKHAWKFGFQVNAYHQTLWQVTYQCLECGLQRTEKKKPVCEVCDIPLHRASPDDHEAQNEIAKPEHQGLQTFH